MDLPVYQQKMDFPVCKSKMDLRVHHRKNGFTGSSLMKKSIFAAGNDRFEVQLTSITSSVVYSGLRPDICGFDSGRTGINVENF